MNERIDRIRRQLADADKLDADASELRWLASRDIYGELAETSITQAELARQIGRSQSFVSRMARMWREHADEYNLSNVAFNEIWNERPARVPLSFQVPSTLEEAVEEANRLGEQIAQLKAKEYALRYHVWREQGRVLAEEVKARQRDMREAGFSEDYINETMGFSNG